MENVGWSKPSNYSVFFFISACVHLEGITWAPAKSNVFMEGRLINLSPTFDLLCYYNNLMKNGQWILNELCFKCSAVTEKSEFKILCYFFRTFNILFSATAKTANGGSINRGAGWFGVLDRADLWIPFMTMTPLCADFLPLLTLQLGFWWVEGRGKE